MIFCSCPRALPTSASRTTTVSPAASLTNEPSGCRRAQVIQRVPEFTFSEEPVSLLGDVLQPVSLELAVLDHPVSAPAGRDPLERFGTQLLAPVIEALPIHPCEDHRLVVRGRTSVLVDHRATVHHEQPGLGHVSRELQCTPPHVHVLGLR